MTKSCSVNPNERSVSIRSAISSASAAESLSPIMSALNWKCSRRRPFSDLDDEILLGESKRAERIDQERNQLGIGCGVALPDNVGIELEVLAQATLLLALVAKELRQGKPFERFLIAAF